MKITRQQLRRLIQESAGDNRIRKVARRAHRLLKEADEPDWDKFRKDYITCKLLKGSGNPRIITSKVDKQIARAKKMPDGFNKLLAYVKTRDPVLKRYPECMKEKGW